MLYYSETMGLLPVVIITVHYSTVTRTSSLRICHHGNKSYVAKFITQICTVITSH